MGRLRPAIFDKTSTVLLDANVLYSRSLRDYILYAAEDMLISVAWSRRILDEMLEHLMANLPTFTAESGEILIQLMNDYFPVAQINPSVKHFDDLRQYDLPDEGDRHVLAAALAAGANILCTSNVKDFPDEVMVELDIKVITPDRLLAQMIEENPEAMTSVHMKVLEDHHDKDGTMTLEALRKTGAIKTARLLSKVAVENAGSYLLTE
jgi:predicted nucleic acid-binding protein